MKVSITCEECGRELLIYRPQEMNRPLFDTETDCDLSKVVAQLTCPRCNPPGPTYGPLTVEMVAEALCDAPPVSCWADWPGGGVEFSKDDFRCMARFVIRLLNEREHRWSDKWKMSEQPVMDWLLNLAREP